LLKYLLFEVSPLFFVYQYKIQEISNREFFVDIAHRRC